MLTIDDQPHAITPGGTYPVVTLALASLALAAFAFPSVAEAVQFSRDAVAAGQWWRIVTSHLTHWTADHLAWDLLSFAVLGTVAERSGRRRVVACLLAAAVVIPIGVAFAHPDLETYRGLSGIDSALFALVLTQLFRRGGAFRAVAGAAGALLAAKVVYECLTGQAAFVDARAGAFVPVPVAHAVGAIVGLAVGAVVPEKLMPHVNVRCGVTASEGVGESREAEPEEGTLCAG